MTKTDVLAPGVAEPPPQQFPDSITMGNKPFLLEYRHDPAHAEDGITVIAPLDDLSLVSAARFDWLVPGFIPEKIETLIRELPKAQRVAFVPVPQTAAAAALKMQAASAKPDFLDALTDALRELTGTFIHRDQWKLDALPAHLRMNIRVMDSRGKMVMTSRDLAHIRRELIGQVENTLSRLPEGPYNRAGILIWDFGPLPDSFEARLDGRAVTLYPAIHDEGGPEDLAIRPFTTATKATTAHAAGLRKLFWIATRRECRSLIDTTPGIEKLRLAAKSLPETADTQLLTNQLAELTAHRAWDSRLQAESLIRSSRGSSEESATSATPGHGAQTPALCKGATHDGASRGSDSASFLHPSIRIKDHFDLALNSAWTRIGASGHEVFSLAESILPAYAPIASIIDGSTETPPAWSAALADIRVQLAYLFTPRFWTTTPYQWLREYPRYLAAIRRRLDKLATPDGPARDSRLLNEIAPLWRQLRIRAEQGGPTTRANTNLVLYRWMLEEYRVTLWGGDQRTIVPVSAKRLEEQWALVISDSSALSAPLR